jgi:hypothetical protein
MTNLAGRVSYRRSPGHLSFGGLPITAAVFRPTKGQRINPGLKWPTERWTSLWITPCSCPAIGAPALPGAVCLKNRRSS